VKGRLVEWCDSKKGYDMATVTKRELNWILSALMLGMLLAALDGTIVSTALPTIVGELHGANHLSWVVVSYLLASTVSTPLWGKLGDLHGRKKYFQSAIVIFLLGSVLSGLANSMIFLILARALQGLGGGGLMVGAQAVIADVVSPKERGRYSGLFGGVFGAATVLGPLLGGFVVDHLSWRWIFYINIPFGAIALIVTAIALPADGERRSHVIDYLGTAVLTVSASCLILFTSLGGSSEAWGSTPSLFFITTGLVLAVVFVFIEKRAVEPILPPRLFANKVFASASAIGFVVGFAMFGAMTFLPLFFQEVRGVSPTASGLRLLPMMVGLFGASIVVGQLVSKGRKYRQFPIMGCAVMTIGLGMLSTIGLGTSSWLMAFYMFILGAGIGMVMQILIVAVQNAVDPSDIGAGTAGSNFFRSIGGSFGTAIFGALYINELPRQLIKGFHGVVPAGLGQNPSRWTPKLLGQLPHSTLQVILHAISASIDSIYRWAVPIAVVALILSLRLPEVTLRSSAHHVAEEIPMATGE